jgi:hypothetical protein
MNSRQRRAARRLAFRRGRLSNQKPSPKLRPAVLSFWRRNARKLKVLTGIFTALTFVIGLAKWKIEQDPQISLKTMKLEQSLTVGQHIQVYVSFVNAGKSPALDVRTSLKLITSQVFPKEPALEDSPASSRSSVGTGVSFHSFLESRDILRDLEDIGKFRNGPYNLYVRGIVRYKDRFGFKHATRFCGELSGADFDWGYFSACPEGNTMDGK